MRLASFRWPTTGMTRRFTGRTARQAILPDGFHLSHRLARTIRQDRFRVTSDTAFAEVIQLCAEAAPGRETTWINGVIERACGDLFARGHAHSIECWQDDRLVGGLYGIALGNAFLANPCSAGLPTRQRWRWRIWSQGSGSGAIYCSTASS